MKLYIIGNGFDKGHKLPTDYWDFRKYLERMHPSFLQAFEDKYFLYGGMTDEEKGEYLWNELEANLANVDESLIMDEIVNIDMDLESGDVGIEDTLYLSFSKDYNYIGLLSKYLKQWVRTIKISDVEKHTSKLTNESRYITFNYTAVLENVYKIDPQNISHIHGSLREYDMDPVLGHGNTDRINLIRNQKQEAEKIFDEKWRSACRIVEDYYVKTFKNIERYIPLLSKFDFQSIDEIYVIGHSLAGVDIGYFNAIDAMTKRKLVWNIFYRGVESIPRLKENIMKAGVENNRIHMLPSSQFFDL